jgi:hypothetical protein
MSNQYTARPWPDRFWDKVNKNGPVSANRPDIGPCWVWTGTIERGGYGLVRDPETHKMVGVHRVSFILEKGPIEPKLDICHKCDNPPCVRPSHLFSGTETENLQDAVKKGRAGFHKFTIPQIQNIRTRLQAGETQAALAIEFGVDPSSISNIHTNRTWRQEVICSKST